MYFLLYNISSRPFGFCVADWRRLQLLHPKNIYWRRTCTRWKTSGAICVLSLSSIVTL